VIVLQYCSGVQSDVRVADSLTDPNILTIGVTRRRTSPQLQDE
jgi:hypothetical protein